MQVPGVVSEFGLLIPYLFLEGFARYSSFLLHESSIEFGYKKTNKQTNFTREYWGAAMILDEAIYDCEDAPAANYSALTQVPGFWRFTNQN